MLKISIVMPTFNQAGYIRRSIDSVLSQKGDFELELIVVDGASTDSTVEVLKSYGQAIRWISEPDKGQSDALNKGLAMAGGQIMGWLNSDDLYEDGALAAAAEVFASEPDTQWVYGKARVIGPDGREVRRWITLYKNLRMRRFSYSKLLAENWISQMGVFWRRSAWEQTGPVRSDLHLAMDYEYWLRLGARWPGRFIDRYLGCFRWYPASKSGANFKNVFAVEIDLARQAAGNRHRWAILWHRVLAARTVAVYTLMRAIERLRGR
jgi:glycosyltransferase involved in cell wall biosynthesis